VETYILNKPRERCQFVMVEKLNMLSKEMCLWDILRLDYGFDLIPHCRQISYIDKIKQKLGLPVKKHKVYFKMDWLRAEINNNEYEVFFDHWSVTLFKNGTVIFDKSRFENDDFFKLIV